MRVILFYGVATAILLLQTAILAAALVLVVGTVLTLPIWWPVLCVMRWHGTEGSRCRDGALQSPVAKYRHPTTKRIVTYLGSVHVANQSLYDELNRELSLAEARGDAILYELITSEFFGSDWMDDEAAKRAMVSPEQAISVMFLGVTPQSLGLRLEKHWTNADIPAEHFMVLEQMDEMRRGFFSIAWAIILGQASALVDLALYHLIPEQTMPYFKRWILQKQYMTVPALLLFDHLIGKLFGGFSEEVVINLRNEILMEYADEALEISDVTILYGGGHLDGVDAALRERGFVLEEKIWLDVYREQKFNMFSE